MKKKLCLLTLSLSALLVSCAFGSEDIEFVQTSNHDGYEATYGEVFEEVFTDAKWEQFISDEDKTYVEVNANCIYAGEDATLRTQFHVETDLDYIDVTYIDINGEAFTIGQIPLFFDNVFEHHKTSKEDLDLSNIIKNPDDVIDMVKTGYPILYPHLSYEAVFNDYIDGIEWNYIFDDEGDDVVEVSGNITYNGKLQEFFMQFIIDEDEFSVWIVEVGDKVFSTNNEIYNLLFPMFDTYSTFDPVGYYDIDGNGPPRHNLDFISNVYFGNYQYVSLYDALNYNFDTLDYETYNSYGTQHLAVKVNDFTNGLGYVMYFKFEDDYTLRLTDIYTGYAFGAADFDLTYEKMISFMDELHQNVIN